MGSSAETSSKERAIFPAGEIMRISRGLAEPTSRNGLGKSNSWAPLPPLASNSSSEYDSSDAIGLSRTLQPASLDVSASRSPAHSAVLDVIPERSGSSRASFMSCSSIELPLESGMERLDSERTSRLGVTNGGKSFAVLTDCVVFCGLKESEH